jgi:hypothetical protein
MLKRRERDSQERPLKQEKEEEEDERDNNDDGTSPTEPEPLLRRLGLALKPLALTAFVLLLHRRELRLSSFVSILPFTSKGRKKSNALCPSSVRSS